MAWPDAGGIVINWLWFAAGPPANDRLFAAGSSRAKTHEVENETAMDRKNNVLY